jgi:hypothetical protein
MLTYTKKMIEQSNWRRGDGGENTSKHLCNEEHYTRTQRSLEKMEPILTNTQCGSDSYQSQYGTIL